VGSDRFLKDGAGGPRVIHIRWCIYYNRRASKAAEIRVETVETAARMRYGFAQAGAFVRSAIYV
jgi:hypothetical protein